jgi:hypothetical protein
MGSTAPNLAETRVTQRPRIFRSASDVDDEDPPGGPHDTRDFEMRLMIYPVVLGIGKRLFDETTDKKPMRLVGNKTVDRDLVLLTYEPIQKA